MTHSTAIIVPGRLNSRRFPNKLLHEVNGKPLILWTAQHIQSAAPNYPLYFALEDDALVRVLRDAGFQVIQTRGHYDSGTERICSILDHIDYPHIINLQADEPMITRAVIEALDKEIQEPSQVMATAATPFEHSNELANPNRVKVALNEASEALYFSRSLIPFPRDLSLEKAFALYRDSFCLHMGVYAYKKDFLTQYSRLKPSPLEQVERLEQLRVLANGYPIKVARVEYHGTGIDTPEDVIHFKAYLNQQQTLAPASLL